MDNFQAYAAFPFFFPFYPCCPEKQYIKFLGKTLKFQESYYILGVVCVSEPSPQHLFLLVTKSPQFCSTGDVLCVSQERYPSKTVDKNLQRSNHGRALEYSKILPLDI